MKSELTSVQQFIKQAPKAELHLHIEGTLEPELLFELALRNNVKLEYPSAAALREAYQFDDLQSFLNIYYTGMQVLLHEQDFYDLTWAYLEKAKQDNIRHTEIFFDPQAHTSRGVAFDTVIKGIHRALQEGTKKLGISSKLIKCFLRDLSAAEAMNTFEAALSHQDKLIGVGLCSCEAGHPPQKFQEVFTRAREAGFLAVAHAGEEGPPDYIIQALDLLKVKRIDHGVRCIEDADLMDRLAREQIPLTVCPLSNIKLKVFSDMKQHPLKTLLQKGICATVNSDDPAYFGGYINQNFIAAQQALSLTMQDIYQLCKNSFNATFLTTEEKQKYLSELDAVYHQYS